MEALEIIVALVGLHPDKHTVSALQNAICKSHQFMRLLLDHYMRNAKWTRLRQCPQSAWPDRFLCSAACKWYRKSRCIQATGCRCRLLRTAT
jgi:hypothetical protein